MKIATLAIITRNDQVLLGYKKKGEIGSQTLNGPGGKCEGDESLVDCIIRETEEELHIRLKKEYLEEVAVITFYAASIPDFEVHVFRTDMFEGAPEETDDMIPGWYDINHLPLDRMLESDREWFYKATTGEKFRAKVHYKARAADFEKIEFFPY